mmetsp:Transcript_5885/g.20023  ORF Transcript_5885/g.20023 Transcript_5885/m.20023 type:complete len:302 (-) Transcript_5885:262-1167(-)
MCLDCSGMHRGLGVHVSFCRSVGMDKWTYRQLYRMYASGNKRARAHWRASRLDPHQKIESKYSTPAAMKYRSIVDTNSAAEARQGTPLLEGELNGSASAPTTTAAVDPLTAYMGTLTTAAKAASRTNSSPNMRTPVASSPAPPAAEARGGSPIGNFSRPASAASEAIAPTKVPSAGDAPALVAASSGAGSNPLLAYGAKLVAGRTVAADDAASAEPPPAAPFPAEAVADVPGPMEPTSSLPSAPPALPAAVAPKPLQSSLIGRRPPSGARKGLGGAVRTSAPPAGQHPLGISRFASAPAHP